MNPYKVVFKRNKSDIRRTYDVHAFLGHMGDGKHTRLERSDLFLFLVYYILSRLSFEENIRPPLLIRVSLISSHQQQPMTPSGLRHRRHIIFRQNPRDCIL